MKHDIHTAHKFRGDLFREDEARTDLQKRIKAHLAEVFPGMKATMRWDGDWYHKSLMVSITAYPAADLSIREEGMRPITSFAPSSDGSRGMTGSRTMVPETSRSTRPRASIRRCTQTPCGVRRR